jgi:DNA-binding response OmpR family regulator
MTIYVVAKDSRLLRFVRVVDISGKFEVIRFGQLRAACERLRRESGAVVLVDWEFSKVSAGIVELGSDGFRDVRSRIFVCVNNIMLLSPVETEQIRFALLQIGVGGVFSQLNELTALLPIFQHHYEKSTPKKQDPFKLTWNSLPWKKHATKLEWD